MKYRWINLAIFALVLVPGMLKSPVLAAGNTIIARVDLADRGDFERFRDLGIKPFFRIENVFFVEMDRPARTAARRAGIPLELIDDQPFSGPYYFGRIESVVSRRMPVTDLERLTEVDRHALYKSATPVDRAKLRRYGLELALVTRREIPLVYFPEVSGLPGAALAAQSPVLDSLVAEVSLDSVYAFNTRLEAFYTRYTFADSNIAAREWLKQKLLDFGYTDVSFQQLWVDCPWYHYSGWGYNVVAVKPGTAEPDKVIVIGGHYDSIMFDGNDPMVYAPGADDDASGTATTLEIARVLAGQPTRKTIIFVLFGAEEQFLYGSWHFANYAVDTGMDIELMINLDMIGYTEGDDYVWCFFYESSLPYVELMADLGRQHTWLDPWVAPSPGAADHLPFYESGYNIAYCQEGVFNYDGWHTALDITSRMDFPYLTEVTKMALATVYTVSSYPAPVADARARDAGDGHSLRVEWTPSVVSDIVGYRVYWGIHSYSYSDSVFVSGNTTSQVMIGGLALNQKYYLTVVAVNLDGDESFLRPQFTGTPRIIPLPPSDVSAETEEWRIELAWAPNQELDLDHYRIYRAVPPAPFTLLVDDRTATTYVDSAVGGGITYDYVITAVDGDQNESAYSAVASAAAATFDQGILIVDQTPPTAGNPSTEEKEAFFDTIFSGAETSYYYYDPLIDRLSKAVIGRYEVVFWFDDGNAAGTWNSDDLDKLYWYLKHNTGLVLAGWRTAFEFAGLSHQKEFSTGDIIYDYAGVTAYEELYDIDFQGAIGEQGFPNAALDAEKVYPVWEGRMGWIGALEAGADGEIIYRYDSYSGQYAGRVVGVRRENESSKFVFLSLPFYYLEDADAHAVIGELIDWFNLGPSCDCSRIGDCTGDGQIDPVDVVYLINYALFMTGPPPPSDPRCPVINRGDFDCDGIVAMTDVVKMVNYVYRYPAPGPCDPCVP